MHRRVQVDLPLHLTITLDGDPHERGAAYCAMLDDIVESIRRIGARYYLRAEQGESITARVADAAEITELTPTPASPVQGRRGAARPRPGRRAARGRGGTGAAPRGDSVGP